MPSAATPSLSLPQSVNESVRSMSSGQTVYPQTSARSPSHVPATTLSAPALVAPPHVQASRVLRGIVPSIRPSTPETAVCPHPETPRASPRHRSLLTHATTAAPSPLPPDSTGPP